MNEKKTLNLVTMGRWLGPRENNRTVKQMHHHRDGYRCIAMCGTRTLSASREPADNLQHAWEKCYAALPEEWKVQAETQLDELRIEFDEHVRILRALQDATRYLASILGKAQNDPPEGESDGSVPTETWESFSELKTAGVTLAAATRRAASALQAAEIKAGTEPK